MKNLDTDVSSIQHGNVRFANLGHHPCRKQFLCIYFCNMITHFKNFTESIMLVAIIVVTASVIYGCNKIIDVDLPDAEPMLVVEGTIKEGEKPMVLLSNSMGYFDQIPDFQEIFVSGASVFVTVDSVEYQLEETIPALLDPALLLKLSDQFKVDPFEMAFAPLPVYSIVGPTDLIGVSGKTYDLRIEHDSLIATASTTLFPTVPLDDSYFYITETSTTDSLGIINIVYTDPVELGNCYRSASRRTNQYPDWHELAGEVKDPYFVYPLGSAWDDMILNGATYDLAYIRYPSENDQLDSLEQGLWKLGDTVLVKLETIDYNAFESILSYETAASAQGNPFASPTNVISHIDNALGWWYAYGEHVDTVICTP